MAKANHYHVVRSGKSWGVKAEGVARAISTSATQAGAQKIARRHAIATKGEVIIHRTNGLIRARDSYGNDPVNRSG
jgi:hypothetical protein